MRGNSGFNEEYFWEIKNTLNLLRSVLMLSLLSCSMQCNIMRFEDTMERGISHNWSQIWVKSLTLYVEGVTIKDDSLSRKDRENVQININLAAVGGTHSSLGIIANLGFIMPNLGVIYILTLVLLLWVFRERKSRRISNKIKT